jgi:hypothetical protein
MHFLVSLPIGEWKNMNFRLKVGPKDKVTLCIWLQKFDQNAKQYVCALPLQFEVPKTIPF